MIRKWLKNRREAQTKTKLAYCEEGQQAYNNGDSPQVSPYRPGTTAFNWWLCGWTIGWRIAGAEPEEKQYATHNRHTDNGS